MYVIFHKMKSLSFLLVLIQYVFCRHLLKENDFSKLQFYKGLPVVQILQEYIRIDTSETENYDLVVEFWKRLASQIGLPIAVYWPAGLPVCVITWTGSQPELPSIVLNTHSDVVPAYDNLWRYPPFEAVIDSNGDLYGRGAQDTKSLAIQHFEAIRELKNNNITLQRTIHITIMPDEEMGGFRGIKEFIKTDHFKKMNVGFVMDEGLSSSDSTFLATYLDRRPWQVNMTFYGQGGHGSEMRDKGSIEKLQYILNSAHQFQNEQKELMEITNNSVLGRYTTMNVNMIKAGIATNIIPSSVNVVIDIRLGTDTNVTNIENMVNTWQNATGPGTTVEFIRRDEDSPPTLVDDSNPYWVAIQNAAHEMNITIKPVVCPATSDMLVIRKLGIPAIGFAPTVNVTPRIHNNDEYVHIETFLQGIQIMVTIVKNLANLS